MRAVALANQAWSATLVRTLLAGGARHVVVSPGSRSTPLVLAFAAQETAVMHTVLDERSAGFFALGLAKATATPTVLVCTSGSAGLHYGPAIAEAAHAEVPLIVLTADRPPEQHHLAAPQTMDQLRLFGSHVAFFANLCTPCSDVPPTSWGVMAAQACDVAQHRQAPVHLNVPFREPLWLDDLPPVPEALAPPAQMTRGAVRLPPATLATWAATLGGIKRGVIVCGPRRPAALGADAAALADNDFGAKVVTLARRLGWPVLAEAASGVRFGAHVGPHLVASYDALLRQPAFAAGHLPDFVLRLGGPPTSKVVNRWLQDAAQSTQRQKGAPFSVAISPTGRWQDPTGGVDAVWAVPDAACCAELAEGLPEQVLGNTNWLDSWMTAEKAAQAALAEACAADFLPGRLIRTIVDALPNHAALHVASSMAIRDLDGFAPPSDKAVRVFCNRGLNGIDGTLATLLGEAAASAVPWVGLLGDLAFLHDAASLALIPALASTLSGVSVTVVVVNNGGGAIFGHLPIAKHPTAFVPYFKTPQAQDIAAVCRGYNVLVTVVAATDDVRGVLTQHVGQRGVHVVEVRMPQEGLAQYRAAWQKVGAVTPETLNG